MRIVVTGREGQVVRSLLERGALAGHDVVPIGRPQLDLASDRSAVLAALKDTRPDLLVSAAAYTAVDKAEAEPEAAFAVNRDGASAVAAAARELDIPLIHISTDYVFDGAKAGAYIEDDLTGPTGTYGASKLAGEQSVSAEQPDNAILRTAWVYSPFGNNFVKTMLRLAGDRDEIGVVADQRANPTSALDIADGVLAVAGKLANSSNGDLRGVFHMTAQGEASWAEFAQAIFDASADLGGPFATVKPITTADFPTPAKRPENSRLDSTKLFQAYGVRLPHWQQSVRQVVGRLLAA